eukprot:1158744-Pelagomonas_calceolata.AAC.10
MQPPIKHRLFSLFSQDTLYATLKPEAMRKIDTFYRLEAMRRKKWTRPMVGFVYCQSSMEFRPKPAISPCCLNFPFSCTRSHMGMCDEASVSHGMNLIARGNM